MKQPDITTERLLLRPFKQADANKVQELAGNFNVSKSTLNIPYPYVDGVAEDWIKKHAEYWADKHQIIYAITNVNDELLLGSVILVNIVKNQADIGYWIGEPYWGLGYGAEAASGLIEFAFTQLGLKKIVADHYSSNPASGAVMRKVGMLHTGSISMKDRFGKVVNGETYEILNT